MERETKLDRYKTETAARERRRQNVAALERDLAQAEEIYRMLPAGSYEANNDRRELVAHIRGLREMIEDERRAMVEHTAGAIDGTDADLIAERVAAGITE